MSGKSRFSESGFLSFILTCRILPHGIHTPSLSFCVNRVINVVRWWVENYWQDFNNNVALLGRLLEFGEMIKAAGFEAEAEQLEASMLAQVCISCYQDVFFREN